jgi:hypothetical protein
VHVPQCVSSLACSAAVPSAHPLRLQEASAEALPQNAADEASKAVKPRVLDEQPLLGRKGGPQATVQRHKYNKPLPPWVNPPPVTAPPPPELPEFEDAPCISDPDEYARQFAEGSIRCVVVWACTSAFTAENLLVNVQTAIPMA